MSTLYSQSHHEEAPAGPSAREHIRVLKDGVLLVRLPSNKRKIEALESSIDETKDPKSKERLKDLKRLTIEETDQLHRAYSEAFKRHFQFCPVYFFYDYQTPDILAGKIDPVTKDLVTRANHIDLSSAYILSIGHTPDTQIDGLVVLDKDLQPLERPFPRSVITSGLPAILASLSSNPAQSVYVTRLNRKLQRFYDKMME